MRSAHQTGLTRSSKPALLLAASLLLGCAARAPAPEPGPPPAAAPAPSYDPSAGCQRALSHLVQLSVKATGAGPSDGERADFLRRCVAVGSDRGSDCVLALQRLGGRRGGPVQLGPALRCLQL